MRAWLEIVLAVLLCLLAPVALAQPAPTPPVPAPVAPAATPPEGFPDGGGGEPYDVADVDRGQPAPFSGILLSEGRFMAVANLRLENDELKGKLRWRDRRIGELEAELAEAREEREPGWWERHDMTIGIVVGAALAGLAVWGAVEVLDSAAGE
jgi:hypothetical protein